MAADNQAYPGIMPSSWVRMTAGNAVGIARTGPWHAGANLEHAINQ
jgi:hypothetical protein